MFHLNDRLLEKLIDGSAAPADVERIQRHAESCRACARRLEEWRDNYPEVDQHFPDLALEAPPSSTVTPSGMLLLPREDLSREGGFDSATGLWVGVVILALIVGYGANRLHLRTEGMDFTAQDLQLPPEPSASPAAGGPAPGPGAPSAAAGSDSARAPRPAARPSTTAPSAPAPPREPPPGRLAVSDRFRAITAAEGARRLGGRLRTLRGSEPDHIEVGPASAVPGAQRGLDVVRVVYRTASGGWILLDQQRIPVDSTGFRPIDDPTLESGQTAYGTSATGVSVATWLDDAGYRISVAVQAPVDSLRRLVQLVR